MSRYCQFKKAECTRGGACGSMYCAARWEPCAPAEAMPRTAHDCLPGDSFTAAATVYPDHPRAQLARTDWKARGDQ